MARALEDITGQRFGLLVAVERSGHRVTPNGTQNSYWLCKCDCGKDKTVRITHLKTGVIRSCGCIKGRYNVPQTVEVRYGGWNYEYELTGKRTRV